MVTIALLLFLPLIGLLVQLNPFIESGGINANNMGNLFHLWEYLLPRYMIDTLVLLMGVSLGVVVLGVGNAWLVVNYQFPGKKVIEFALIAPMAIPAYLMAYLMVDLLQFSGTFQTSLRILLGLDSLWFLPDPRSLVGAMGTFTFCFYPYVYLITRSQFMEHSSLLMDASKAMGYSPVKTFYKLALPLARPSIVAGMALVWMEVLADYGAVSYFGVHTLSTGIFKAWLSFGDRVTAIQLALSLFIFITLIFFIEQMSRSNIRYANQTRGPYQVKKLTGIYALLAFVITGGTVLIGFALPVILLLQSVYQQGFQIDGPYLNWLRNSLLISVITAFISVGLAINFAYVVRIKQRLFWANRLLGFGYAIPGAVMAIGILSFLEVFDLAWWMSTSIWILIYAYVVRFLASSIYSIEAGLLRITVSIDQSAAILGLTKYQILKKIHLPLLSRSVGIAGIFVFVDVMKELPATMLLRPFNYDTLAIKIYQLASDERLIELALPALTIVIVGLIPVVLLTQVMEHSS